MKQIYVITGGTLVHISPHFSLCAPAYGRVGSDIYNRLLNTINFQGLEQQYQVLLIRTKMAGQNFRETECHLKEKALTPSPETNQDIKVIVSTLAASTDTAGIVVASAICDFEPVELKTCSGADSTTIISFGKEQKRLHHVDSLTLTLRPSDKIIDLVKQIRTDIFLVTFKTTVGTSEAELFDQAFYNLRRSKSDLVFANDIQNHHNMVVTSSGEKLQGENRSKTLDILCDKFLDGVRRSHCQ